MSNTTNDGGPAFPIPYGQVMTKSGMGMTLRDWFAGQVLTGMLSQSGRYSMKDAAENAYAFADAMIAQRNGGAE
jgi:hypothetical protein